jgi:hypothetical protein
MEIWVQPIVVYPKWWVDGTNRYNKTFHQVWVCNQGYIDGLVTDGAETLSLKEIQQIYNCLAEHMKNNNIL